MQLFFIHNRARRSKELERLAPTPFFTIGKINQLVAQIIFIMHVHLFYIEYFLPRLCCYVELFSLMIEWFRSIHRKFVVWYNIVRMKKSSDFIPGVDGCSRWGRSEGAIRDPTLDHHRFRLPRNPLPVLHRLYSMEGQYLDTVREGPCLQGAVQKQQVCGYFCHMFM